MSTHVSDDMPGISRDSSRLPYLEATGDFIDVAHNLADDTIRLSIVHPDYATWLDPLEARAVAAALIRCADRAESVL
ncbi:hypothetical protein [Nocardioides sp.]|uniref:hypothetical protein n=1 Tax=Nocardioides sp. TaxID=35761 RepID=UPI002BCB4F7D|nr:hypothetical protein [Nocardioides sp.]HSX68120.1 hypothetical protein [Nocardioides sp.]